MKPIVEEVLGDNTFYTQNYYIDTINLAKSIIVKNEYEARLYNDLLETIYPGYVVNKSDKTTWRYYKHLNGEYHEKDTAIELTSIDNGSTFILTKENIRIHKKTRKELLKFGLAYDELVSKYKTQELLIKSIITDSIFSSIDEIIQAEDYTITAYNSALIEPQETTLIYELQDRLYNYKNIWLIPYYSLSDSLFLASQYTILYHFILKSILGIRLKNVKTIRAHSYHINNYFASHHGLDIHYNYLTDEQRYYLYRNLLYLDNHSGLSHVFKELIDVLLTKRNISLVSYLFKQKRLVDDNDYMQYAFKQKLLNDKNFIYDTKDFTLDEIKDKETPLAINNEKEYQYHQERIDFKFKNSLFNILMTKDLESVVVDVTDSIKYKFIPLMVDFWAYLLKTNRINFLVDIISPENNKEYRLNTKDLFKLYILALFKYANIELEEFPPYLIKKAVKEPNEIDKEALLSLCYRTNVYYKYELEAIINALPIYRNIITSYDFYVDMKNLYLFELGLWILLSNYDEVSTNGQFEKMTYYLHKSEYYEFNDESVTEFLDRINMPNFFSLSNDVLEDLMFNILNKVFDDRLDFLTIYEYIQKSMIDILRSFTSYTVQFIKDYYLESPLLVSIKDRRVDITKDTHGSSYKYNNYLLNVETGLGESSYIDTEFLESYKANYKYHGKSSLDLSVKYDKDNYYRENINALIFNLNKVETEVKRKSHLIRANYLTHFNINNLELIETNWMVDPPSMDLLLFLVNNS